MNNTMQSTLSSSLFEAPTIAPPATVSVMPTLPLRVRGTEDIVTSLRPTSQGSTSAHGTTRRTSHLKLAFVYALLFVTPIASAFGITLATGSSGDTALAFTSPTDPTSALPATADYQRALPASADSARATGNTTTNGAANSNSGTAASSTNSNDLEYELSLANGFLQKAVKLSNASEQQTVDEKNTIIQLLNQALEAANRAVAMAPQDPRGYTSRGRVYQTTSAIKPEMKSLADQDFAKAAELGSANPTDAPATQNPMELLPTEQATTNSQAMIAAPTDSQEKQTVSSDEQANAKRGSVTLESGKTEVYVPYTQVKSTTQLYVTADNNPENLTLYVKNKEEGSGFTVASTSAPSSPVEITWWEIE